MQTYAAFERRCGFALMAAGLLTIVINAAVTPLLPRGGSFADVAASTAFLWRQSLSAVAAVLLMFGAIGLHLRQIDKAGGLGAVAFVLAFIGSGLLLATEWVQVFEIRDLAQREPAALLRLDENGPSLADVGAMIALSTLVIGWIALAASTWRSGIFPRLAPALVIAGLFATPLLQAALPALAAIAIGNALLGGGWAWLGWVLSRPSPAREKPL